MVKFENVDVLAYLEKIMQQNTGYFQSDFEIDRKIMEKAAAQPAAEDRTLLWMSRPSGTHCFRERDVLVKDTAAHNTWRFHKEQTRDPILAYAVKLTGKMDGKLMGNLYELDYPAHYERIKERSLPAAMNMLVYEKGTRMLPAGRAFDGSPDRELGKFLHFETIPSNPELLTRILQEEKRSHDRFAGGEFSGAYRRLAGETDRGRGKTYHSRHKAACSSQQPGKDTLHGAGISGIYDAGKQQGHGQVGRHAAV